VDVLMQDVDGSTADLLKEAGRMVQELAGESRRNWETRARNQAMRVMHVASEAYESLGSRQWTMQDCREYEEELESELKAYRKIAGEVKLSKLSTKMRQDAKLRQQGIDTEVYCAQRQVARIILAHECNLTQPNRTAPGRNSRSETRSTRGVESAESAGTSGSMDFTVPLDRQSSRRPNQTYVVGGMEGSSQDDFELDRELPGRNQENDDLSAASLREGCTRSRGLTVRISERQERDRPIQPEGASTPLDEVRPMMLEILAASSVRPDYRRQLEMDTQDSEEDFFFRGSRRYPGWGAGAFSSAGQGAEHPSGIFSSADRNTAQPPRPPPQRQSHPEPPQQEHQERWWDPPEQSQNQDKGRREEQSRRSQESQNQRGAEPPPGRDRRRSLGAGGGGGGYDNNSDDDLGYRPPNRSRSGGGSGGGSGNRGRRGASPGQNAAGGVPPPPPPARGGGGAGAGGPPIDGFGGFAQGLTNAMNAIANQVIRASGKSVKNGGWPYFDGTFKEYPSFKRKFRT
jgi:hypothetical protein